MFYLRVVSRHHLKGRRLSCEYWIVVDQRIGACDEIVISGGEIPYQPQVLHPLAADVLDQARYGNVASSHLSVCKEYFKLRL